MSADWKRLSRAAGIRLEGDRLAVTLGDRRTQRIAVEDATPESLRLVSVVARPLALRELATPQIDAWRRNRLTELVGFSVDRHGRMVGEAWVPKHGLTAGEWQFHVRTLAQACDRFEYLLTGVDEE